MVTVKIHYKNCEEEGEVEIHVNCQRYDFKNIERLISNFKKENIFSTGDFNFIKMLKEHGYDARSVKYDIEVW